MTDDVPSSDTLRERFEDSVVLHPPQAPDENVYEVGREILSALAHREEQVERLKADLHHLHRILERVEQDDSTLENTEDPFLMNDVSEALALTRQIDDEEPPYPCPECGSAMFPHADHEVLECPDCDRTFDSKADNA